MNKINKTLNVEHKAIGGLYFIFTSIVCALIMTSVLKMSYSSQMITVMDNFAFIVATDCLTVSYNNDLDSYTVENGLIGPYGENSLYYDVESQFELLLSNYLSRSDINTTGFKVAYNKTSKTLRLQINTVEINRFDLKIKPHQQDVVIE